MRSLSLAIILLSLSMPSASAHSFNGSVSSLYAGLEHPISGVDHISAMVAVGMLAASRGGRALWLWPLSFVGMMAIGGALGMAQLQFPYVEIGILVSVLVLGAMVVLSIAPPLWIGAALIGSFAVLHGYAHGGELPHSANGVAFAVGFAGTTICLHLVGIALAAGSKAIARPPTSVGAFARISRKQRW